MPHIEIRIQLEHWPSDTDERIVVPLDEYITREAMQTLDFPRPGTDALVEAVFCTPRVDRARVKRDRKMLADLAADYVRERLMQMLGKNDTENGYKQTPSQETKHGE